MTIDHPLVLWALPALAGVVWLFERRLAGGAGRRTARLLVRTLLLGLVLAALAGVQREGWEDLERRLVVVVDRAARLGPSASAEAEALARTAATRARKAGAAASVLGFTTRAVPEGRTPPATAESIAALGLAGARLAFHEHETGGVLLITDGRGDLDGLAAAAAALRADGYAVTAAAVPKEAPPAPASPRILQVEHPSVARGPFPVRVALDAADAPRLVAMLRVDGTERARLTVEARDAGDVRLGDLDLQPGLHEIAVAIRRPGDDDDGVEALARGLVQVDAPPRVVALLGDAAGSPFRQALSAQGLHVAAVEPDAVASFVGDTHGLPGLVLADAAALAGLPPETAGLLAERVRGGLGLLLEAGGSRASWEALARSPLAAVLPVQPLPQPEPPPPPPTAPEEVPEPPLEPPEPEEGPGISVERRPEEALPITLLLVVDRSPSMIGAKLQMAIEGARRAALALSPWDRVGVVTFAHDRSLDIPPRSARTAASLPLWLSSVKAGGEGTDIYGALQLAGKVLAEERSPILHLILLTDGMQWPGEAIFGPVVKPMRALGVTITAVGIGRGANMRELREIVQWAAGGMVIPVRDAREIPTVLARDTQGVARMRSVEAERLARLRDPDAEPVPPDDEAEPEAPPPALPREPEARPPTPPPDVGPVAADRLPLRIVRRHEALSGLDEAALPRVGPPRKSEPVSGAAVLMAREDGGVVLAARRAGLGRVLAWCLPAEDPGALGWPALGRLAGQAARATLAPRGAFAYLPTARVRHGPEGALLQVEWPRGETHGRLRVRWRGPDGTEQDLGTFSPSAGDEDEGRPLPAAPPGSLCHLDLVLEGGPPLPPQSYLVARPPRVAPAAGDARTLSEALAAPLEDPAAFAADLPRGRRPASEPLWPWILWIAVALLPLDVWLHRRRSAL